MEEPKTGTPRLKTGLAEMLKGGVIMDVTDAEQARIAEDAGAVAVMALERVPSDIRKDGGVARMSDPAIIEKIMETVLMVSRRLMRSCRTFTLSLSGFCATLLRAMILARWKGTPLFAIHLKNLVLDRSMNVPPTSCIS